MLLRHDAYSTPFKFDNKLDLFKGEKEDSIKPLLNSRLFSNLIEKYIVFSNDTMGEDLYIKDLNSYHNMLINTKTWDDKSNFLSKLFFMMSNEQMIFQERSIKQYIFRVITIFGDCDISKQRFFDISNIGFEKYLALLWFLFVHIAKQKHVVYGIRKKEFKRYLYTSVIKQISENDIDLFFDSISISKEKFIELYKSYRIDKNGNTISYDKLNIIDAFLPKVSFHYPFIKYDKDSMMIVSYTALMQHMHLERIFSMIAEDDYYRSNTLGPLLEKYIFNLFLSMQKKQKDIIKVHYYEQQQYNPKKGITRHLPDIIIEGNDFIIFIESKTSAVNLKDAMHDFSKDTFENAIEAVEKSKTNISEYIKYNPLSIKDLDKKKIYKFVCFNIVSPTMLSALYNADFIDCEDLMLTDLSSLEVFTHINEKIDFVQSLDEFESSIKSGFKASDLYRHSTSNYTIDETNFIKTHEKILTNYINKEIKNTIH
ncbi:hypothetical protein Q6A89_07790 [Aliarcobacter skirrowii]|uniref:hypothetical protein n=2 Tax=Arcobacteraceae TaxID=2808963 RepID=UPI0029B0708A|nr:hypothetical protein [Aliarcobacter skirrowii]MDX4060411.1 hypothetical protein [Aliarcobacter skirrowii]